MIEGKTVLAATLPPPRYQSDACAAQRSGIAGCKACSDICPHDALRFTTTGPQIDGDACRRCGACTAACPVGALERAYLPDDELLGTVESAIRAQPELLILACGHETPAPENGAADGIVRLAIPCVQLVSDDLLVFAVLQGAGSVRVEPSPSCPHAPHRQTLRAVQAARETLRARGWNESRISMGAQAREAEVAPPEDRKPPIASKRLSATELGSRRFERRMVLLEALEPRHEVPSEARAVSRAAPWRFATVNEDRCTTCGTCAFLCPTGALALGENGTALYGREAACIGCELCTNGCPERAVTLSPVIPETVASRLLVRSTISGCESCGRPLLPESLIKRVEGKLARLQDAPRRALRLCEHCKGLQLFDFEGKPGGPPSSDTGKAVSTRFEDGASTPSADGVSRRDFVRTAATVATGAMALGALGGCSQAAGGPEAKHRYGMVIDTKRCVGCEACVVACKAENKTPPGVNYMLVTNNTLGARPDDKPLFTAKPCFHCEKPPCVDVCPVSATFKRKKDGIVVVDYDRCIGCRYCQTACPYGARYFDFGESYHAETAEGPYNPPSPEYSQFRPRTEDGSPIGNVRKCTFCMHLQDESGEYDKKSGRWPACAKTCTGHAIHFGDLKDPDSDVSRLIRERQPVRMKDELGTQPNVSYLL